MLANNKEYEPQPVQDPKEIHCQQPTIDHQHAIYHPLQLVKNILITK